MHASSWENNCIHVLDLHRAASPLSAVQAD
jgi:hypothetical protein